MLPLTARAFSRAAFAHDTMEPGLSGSNAMNIMTSLAVTVL